MRKDQGGEQAAVHGDALDVRLRGGRVVTVFVRIYRTPKIPAQNTKYSISAYRESCVMESDTEHDIRARLGGCE